MKRGRPGSFANFHPIGGEALRAPLSPVVKLTTLERSIFNLTVTRHPHLKPKDVVLVTAFARAAARVLKMSGNQPAELEKATRTMVLLGRSLRLTPMNALEPRTVARSHRDAMPDPLGEYLADREAEAIEREEAKDDDDGHRTH
jgi:hypothetical protein